MSKARKIAVIDCETDPFKLGRIPKPFLWGFYDGKIYKEFKKICELMEFLNDKNYLIYAHNGGKFDYFFMLDYLENFSELTIISGRLAKFKVNNCEFRDSYNILPIPLEAYQKTKIDYNKFEEDVRHKYIKEISDYLKDDCVFLYNLINEFIKEYGRNLTIAGSAIKEWGKIKGKVPETNQEFYHKFNKFYYGGRVECFKKGIIKGNNLQSYDINSAYPYAMLEMHPYGSFNVELNFDGKFINQNFYMIRAKSRGALPLRDKTGLNFPHSEDIFNVTGWEINAGLRTNTLEILEVIKCFHFPEQTDFKEYVNHFYMKKEIAGKNKDKAGYLFAKLFLNALYGKFGANPEKYNENIILDKKYIKAGIEDGYEFAGELGKWALMRQSLSDEKMRFYNVATASSITGFVRAFLWEHIHKVASHNEVIYCDTDCIIFNGNKNLPFEVGGKLGQWEKEGDYDIGAVCGKKLYAFKYKNSNDYKIASKGCRLSHNEIFKIAKGNEILYEDIAPTFSIYKEPRFNSRLIKAT